MDQDVKNILKAAKEAIKNKNFKEVLKLCKVMIQNKKKKGKKIFVTLKNCQFQVSD